MKRKHLESEPVAQAVGKEEVEFFRAPLEQNCIARSFDIELQPVMNINNQAPITFHVPRTDKQFTDLGKTWLEVDLQILKSDGSKLTSADKGRVQPVNLLFDALWSRINVRMNSVSLQNETTCHSHVALLKYMLNYDPQMLRDDLGPSLVYYSDYPYPLFHNHIRYEYIADSKPLHLVGRLSENIFTADRLFPPQVEFTISLERTPAQFCLIRPNELKTKSKVIENGREVEKITTTPLTDTYQVKINDAHLIIRRAELVDAEVSRMEAHLSRGSRLKYEYTRTEPRIFHIPAGMKHAVGRNLFGNKMPSRVLFGVCHPDAVSTGGAYNVNPHVWPAAHYKVNYVQFLKDNVPLLRRAYTPDFKSKRYNREYIQLLRAARVLESGRCVALSSEDFGQSYGIFAIDLQPDNTHLSSSEPGELSIEVHFEETTPTALAGFAVAEYRALLEIDKNFDLYQFDI